MQDRWQQATRRGQSPTLPGRPVRKYRLGRVQGQHHRSLQHDAIFLQRWRVETACNAWHCPTPPAFLPRTHRHVSSPASECPGAQPSPGASVARVQEDQLDVEIDHPMGSGHAPPTQCREQRRPSPHCRPSQRYRTQKRGLLFVKPH